MRRQGPAFVTQSLLTTSRGLSTLCDIPTHSIRLERDKTSIPMPLVKVTKLLKTATEQAAADQLNAAGYAFL